MQSDFRDGGVHAGVQKLAPRLLPREALLPSGRCAIRDPALPNSAALPHPSDMEPLRLLHVPGQLGGISVGLSGGGEANRQDLRRGGGSVGRERFHFKSHIFLWNTAATLG